VIHPIRALRYRGAELAYQSATRAGAIGLAGEALSAMRLPRSSAEGEFRILCLSKPVFAQDVAAVARRSQRLTFLSLPGIALREVVRRHVRDVGCLTDATYHPLVDGTPEQARIRADMRVLFGVLHKRLAFDAVFVGNFTYPHQQEFFRVARESGVPVVVLYKEGMIPGGKAAYAGSQLLGTKQFHAGRILFYNESSREMLLTARVPGLEAEQTAVVGVPRFDDYFASPSRPPEQPHIVLFAFSPEWKAAYLAPDQSRHPAFTDRLAHFQADFVRYAAERPDVTVTIKTKTAVGAIDDVRRLLEGCGISRMPGNVRVTSAGDPPALLRRATAAAGYSSTTLLESLMLRVPVICPALDDILPNEVVDYFDEAPDAVTRVGSYAALRAALDQPSRLAAPDAATRDRVLTPLVYRTDGRASERVEAELVEAIVRARTT
jgi:hypothetical protein